MRNKIEFIKKYIDKDFYFITGIFVLAVLKVINYCNPILFGFNFNVSEKTDKFLYEICVGLIVTYIFYFIVTFIPEIKAKKQKEKALIPLKCMMYREVQLLLSKIFDLLSSLMSYSNAAEREYSNIGDYLNYDDLVNALKSVKLSDISGKLDSRVDFFKPFENKEYIYYQCEDIQSGAKGILQSYMNTISNKLSYSIFYLVNECPLFSGYAKLYSIDGITNTKDEILYNHCTIHEDNLYKSIQHIINIYEWTQGEYKYLKENLDENSTIYPIDFKTYIPKVNRCKTDSISKI